MSNLISPKEASKHFRKAERARTSRPTSCLTIGSSYIVLCALFLSCGCTGRQRTRYVYPPSSSSSSGHSRSSSRSPTRRLPLPARLRALQADLAALEAELEDPSNPALQAREKDGEGVDPGEMIRGLVDVRRRLEMVRREREGRGRLVGVVVGEGEDGDGDDRDGNDGERVRAAGNLGGDVPEARRIVEMDKRVGELEKLVGSVSATLDEVSKRWGV